MKLQRLFSESNCKECQNVLKSVDYLKSKDLCRQCGLKVKKAQRLKDEEAANKADTENAVSMNLFNVSRQMPDRGHDAKRGTAGWVMGGVSPGRSF